MKILKNLRSLKKINSKYKDKTIGMCHGVFDLLRRTHRTFQLCEEKSNILLVSITDDKYVNKGPNKPYNNSLKRAKVLRLKRY